VDYAEARFREIEREYREFVMRLGLHNLAFIPVSALQGDNVVNRSERMPWYSGQALLPYLEEVYVAGDGNLVDFRFPVQRSVRAAPGFRGCSGRIASGIMRAGDDVLVLPAGFRSRIATIDAGAGAVEMAGAGRSVTITLHDEIDIGRGDIIVHPGNVPREFREVEAMVVWTGNEDLTPGTTYWLKHATQWIKARCEEVHYSVDPNTLRRAQAASLKLNDIGRVRFSLFKPIYADQYQRNRALGAFIIVSQNSNDSVGAATIVDRADYDSELKAERAVDPARNITWHAGQVNADDRARLLLQRPATLWLTGFSGAGKSTVACALERKLFERGQAAYVLDGDNVRHNLNRDLGFSPIDRAENIRRIAEVARLMNDAGLIVITAFISPYIDDRKMAREIIGAANFLEVYLDTPIQVCETRDPKGLYKRARSGEISGFTGVSAPYEPPINADLSLDTAVLGVDRCVEALLKLLAPKL
jgi:bifunctional enzyme CysN/CysC